MMTHICHHNGAVADPRVSTDRNVRPGPLLIADRNVETVNAVLSGAVHDRHMRTDQHIIRQCHFTQAAKDTDIHVPADIAAWMRENSPERDRSSGIAALKHHAIKSAAQVSSRHPGNETE